MVMSAILALITAMGKLNCFGLLSRSAAREGSFRLVTVHRL